MSRDRRVDLETRAGKCMWPIGMTPKRNLVRLCRDPVSHVTQVSKIAVCSKHARDNDIPIEEYLS